MAVTHIQQRTHIGVGTYGLPGFLPVEHFVLKGKLVFVQHGHFVVHIAQVARLDGHIEVTRFQIAIDAIATDTLANNFVPGPAHIPNDLPLILGQALGNTRLPREPANQLPAITSGSAPAYLVGLHHMHLIPALRQTQGCGYTGKPRADHTDIRLLRAC